MREDHRSRVERSVSIRRGRIVEASGHWKIYRWRACKFCFQPSGADCGREHRKGPEPHSGSGGTGGPAAWKSDPLGFCLTICARTQSASFEFSLDGTRSDDLFPSKAALCHLPSSLLLSCRRSGVAPKKENAPKNREKNGAPFSGVQRRPDPVATELGQALARFMDFAGAGARFGSEPAH